MPGTARHKRSVFAVRAAGDPAISWCRRRGRADLVALMESLENHTAESGDPGRDLDSIDVGLRAALMSQLIRAAPRWVVSGFPNWIGPWKGG